MNLRSPASAARHSRAFRALLDVSPSPDPGLALATAALVALHAPSIHNTQPWHWRVGVDSLELFADERWRLQIADPDGRLLILSCGAALHHVRVALRAMGYLPAVQRFPEQGRPDLLARVTLERTIDVAPQALDALRATLGRQTDRRSVDDKAVPAQALDAMRQAASSEGAWLHVLSREQARKIIATAEHAEGVEVTDPKYRAELDNWTGESTNGTAGIPKGVLPPRGDEYQPTGSYAVLYGNGDRPSSWLRGGEALSAIWLAATSHSLALRPISSVIEVPAARAVLHQVLSGMGCPYLLVRIGLPAEDGELPGTPRRPVDESIELTPPPSGRSKDRPVTDWTAQP
ncbi:MAG TPA: nitroreductase [Micromonosporaceae bacterium]